MRANTPRIQITERGVFSLLLFLFVLLLVVLALFYPYRARMAPLAVGISTLLFLLFQCAMDWFPSLERRLTGFHGSESGTADSSLAVREEGARADLGIREMRLFLWLLGFAFFFYLVGILFAVPLFALGYIRFESHGGWRMAFGYALIAWLLVYLLLVQLLNAQLSPGLLFNWLGIA